MSMYRIIVIGASAGGVEALRELVRELPSNLNAALFVVLHVPATAPSALPLIIKRSGSLEAFHPSGEEQIQPGKIYVAPPDHHLLLSHGRLQISRGPKENRSRPSINPLFRTAASVYGSRVVGVILSGALDDGTLGLWEIKRQGGTVIVQDPEEALFASMPMSAISNVEVDYVLPVSQIARLLVRLSAEALEQEETDTLFAGEAIESAAQSDIQEDPKRGELVEFGCPACGGALREHRVGPIVEYRCRTGHAFSVANMLAEQSAVVERALSVALRAQEERIAALNQLVVEARESNRPEQVESYSRQAAHLYSQAGRISQLLSEGDLPS